MIIEEPSLLMFMGRLHPLVLHFPVALLMLAALLELIQKYRHQINYSLLDTRE